MKGWRTVLLNVATFMAGLTAFVVPGWDTATVASVLLVINMVGNMILRVFFTTTSVGQPTTSSGKTQ